MRLGDMELDPSDPIEAAIFGMLSKAVPNPHTRQWYYTVIESQPEGDAANNVFVTFLQSDEAVSMMRDMDKCFRNWLFNTHPAIANACLPIVAAGEDEVDLS